MGKWTNEGFVANNLDTYKDQLREAFKEAYGDDFDTNDATPQGILITRIAELLYNTDMDGIQAYAMFNLNTMSGVFLDMIGARRGITRSLGWPQQVFVKVTCIASNFQVFSVPAGTIFKTVGGDDTFVLEDITTIKDPTNSVLRLSYTESGDSSASAGTKLQVSGFGQIVDLEVTSTVEGRGRESDMDYRRRLQTEYPAANNTIEWVQNKLLEHPLVRVVGANYNDEAVESGGLKPYTTEWMAVPVDGADEEVFIKEVATIIVNNKVPGAPTDGNTTAQVNDMFGTEKTVKFTIPEKVELEIDIRLSTPESTGFLDLSNINTIREEMAKYINNLEIGKDVSYSRCAAMLFADKGFDVQMFRIKAKGTDEWVDNRNFDIGFREYAAIEESDIVIGV